MSWKPSFGFSSHCSEIPAVKLGGWPREPREPREPSKHPREWSEEPKTPSSVKMIKEVSLPDSMIESGFGELIQGILVEP